MVRSLILISLKSVLDIGFWLLGKVDFLKFNSSLRTFIPPVAEEYLAVVRMARIVAVTFISTFFWLPIPIAQAHAGLVSSTPSAGAYLDAIPSQVSLTFDNALLQIGGSGTNFLIVRNEAGVEVDAKNSKISGAKLTVDINPRATSGKFSVRWRVVAGDGHPEEGSFQFTVGIAPAVLNPTPSRSASATSTPKVIGQNFWSGKGTRLLLLAGLAIAIGIWIQFERRRRKLG